MSQIDAEFRILLEHVRDSVSKISNSLVAIGESLKEYGNANSKAKDADNEQGEMGPSKVSIQLDPSLAAHLKEYDHQSSKRDTKRRITELVALGAVIAYSVVALLQWQEMNIQSRNSATAIEKSISDSIISERNAGEQLAIARVQADAAKTSVQAAKDSTDAAIERDRLDQRAWVTVQDITAYKLVIGETPCVKLVVVNSGKTPAIRATGVATLFTRLSNDDIGFFAMPPHGSTGSISQAVIGPSTTMKISVCSETGPASKPSVEAFLNGTTRMWSRGVITYRDVFHRDHFTKFCFFTDAATLAKDGNMMSCKQDNDAN